MENKYGIRHYNVSLHWKGEGQWCISLPSLHPLLCGPSATKVDSTLAACSAEHLFIAAVGSCFMSTFFKEAEHAALAFLLFECTLFGCVEQEGNQDMLGDIILKPNVQVAHSHDVHTALQILSTSIEKSIIAHSVRTRIHLAPTVEVQEKQAADK